MARDVEVSSFDLRYEGYRMKVAALEAKLLVSIQECGVEEPLEGVEVGERRILLNGFKRYRCAQRLGLGHVPFISLGDEEASGIVALLRASNEKSLSILEQACFLEDLVHLHKMSLAQIAETLRRSKSWVAMRVGLLGEMSPLVREQLLRGAFPVYSYMYALRPFMRMNDVRKKEVEAFVLAVSGKKLSVREIARLAQGYFQGPEWFRTQIDGGHLALVLERTRQEEPSHEGCRPFEQALLRDLEILSKYLQRVIGKSRDPRLSAPAFRAQASLLLGGILCRMNALRKALEELHARCAQA
jgi:predicted transcriptional regulator